MSLADQVQDLLTTEENRKQADSEFRKAIDTIDSLKQQGILERTKYRLPLSDTVGRRLAEKQSAAYRESSACQKA